MIEPSFIAIAHKNQNIPFLQSIIDNQHFKLLQLYFI